MILRRLREGFGEGTCTGLSLPVASADDGKRLSEYLQVRSCAVRFMREKEMRLKTRGRVRGGEGLGVPLRRGVGG